MNKKTNEDIERFIHQGEETLSNSSTELLLMPPLDDHSVSEEKVIIRHSKKSHNFLEKPVVHTSNPFIQIREKRVPKPYKPYLPHTEITNLKKKSSLKFENTVQDQRKKKKKFEPQPGANVFFN